MRITSFALILLFLFSLCSPEQKEPPKSHDSHKITFIRNQDEADTEVVIKRMIRHSISDAEYILLRPNDTLELDSPGKAFFKIGVRATVLDSLIVDGGDVLSIKVHNDSLQIVPLKSDLNGNLHELNSYVEKVEGMYEEICEPIIIVPDHIQANLQPLLSPNDYEIQELSLMDFYKYEIDKDAYNENKGEFDRKIKETYLEWDSLIAVSDLDMGSKQILGHALFHSTLSHFRRMGHGSMMTSTRSSSRIATTVILPPCLIFI